MAPVGFETTFSTGERPHFYALDRAATGIGELAISMFASIKNIAYMFATISMPLLF
jgi:hypothetical protein